MSDRCLAVNESRARSLALDALSHVRAAVEADIADAPMYAMLEKAEESIMKMLFEADACEGYWEHERARRNELYAQKWHNR